MITNLCMRMNGYAVTQTELLACRPISTGVRHLFCYYARFAMLLLKNHLISFLIRAAIPAPSYLILVP